MASCRLVALAGALALGSVTNVDAQLRHFPPFKTIDEGATPAEGCALLEGNYVPVEGYADCDLARIAFDTQWHWRQPECGEVDCTPHRPTGCTHHPNFGHFNSFPACNTGACGIYGMNCVCIDADAATSAPTSLPPTPPPPPTTLSPPAPTISCGGLCGVASAPPVHAGCSGKLLTDPSNIFAEANVVRDVGSGTTTLGPGATIDLANTDCLRLGTPGSSAASFSLTFWLKAGSESDCFADPIVRGVRGDRATVIGQKVDTLAQTGWRIGTILNNGGLSLELKTRAAGVGYSINHDIYLRSATFKAGSWSFVTLTYDAVSSLATLTVNSQSESIIVHQLSDGSDGGYPASAVRIGSTSTNGAAFAVQDMRSYGGLLPAEDQLALFAADYADLGFSVSDLSAVLQTVDEWVAGTAVPDATEIVHIHETLARNGALLQLNEPLMRQILDTIDAFETDHPDGPLFLNPATRSFDREANDGLEFYRAVFAVQQTAIDMLYTAAAVRDCGACVLEGRDFKAAKYWPGNNMDILPPADPSVVHTVDVNASMPARWGRPAAFDQQPERQPTGLYVAPAAIATVTVPASWIARGGYEVLVGAHTWDHKKKATHKRFDRVTTRFAITETTTHVTNPLGGGVYIMVPYLAAEGVGAIQIAGGVIKAPFFKLDSWNESRSGSTDAEWLARRAAPAPWAVFATDKFMMDVPSSWITAMEPDNVTGLLRRWDMAMDGVSEVFGRPPNTRNKKVCYYQNDITLPGGAHGIGYPQVNHLWNPLSTAVGHQPIAGYANSWYLRDPASLSGAQIEFHETGHAQGPSMYRGEGEAIVNFIHPYINSRKFGLPLEEAFRQSFNRNGGFTMDEAANHWMATDNFRLGNDMETANNESNQLRYQERGYAKYADFAELFGWEPLVDAFYQEHVDYNAGTMDTHHAGPGAVLRGTDQRTVRFSVAAGVDVTPLIDYWGIKPEHPAELAAEIARQGLGPSPLIHDILIRRATEVLPQNNSEFNEHFERVFPGRPVGGNPNYGVGWYNVWRDVWDAQHAAGARGTIQDLLDAYFPVQTWTSQYLAETDHGVDASTVPERCYVGVFAGADECSAGGIYKIVPAEFTTWWSGAAADPLDNRCGELVFDVSASWASAVTSRNNLMADDGTIVLATYQAALSVSEECPCSAQAQTSVCWGVRKYWGSVPATHTVSWGYDVSQASITIHTGDTVKWVLQQDGHDVVSAATLRDADGTFDSNGYLDNLAPPGQWSHTFEIAGTYPYYCTPHQSMVATITVEPY